jgi:hypothetical protein
VRRVKPIFEHLHDHVRGHFAPKFRARLKMGKASEFPERRNMAYCMTKAGCPEMIIVVAPKMENAPIDNIEGVLAHEFGHAILFHCGHWNHTEREADQAAEALFGAIIRYDNHLIQSTTRGIAPRPAHLG